MDNYRRQQVQAKAAALLEAAAEQAIPVDVLRIAAHLEVAVHAKPPEAGGASGWLIRVGNEFAIVYATHVDNKGFQSFSIAHELGHYWLDGHPEHVFRDGDEHASRAGFGSADHIEQEADYFAACLLMPLAQCRPLLSRSVDGLAAVKSLADRCNTSLIASAIRYVEIGGLHAGVIVCHNGRVEYCSTWNLQKRVGWASPMARGARAPIDSATWRLSQDAAAVRACLEDSETASASDWFAGASSKMTVVEEVIGLGSYERTLTLLTLEEVEEEEEADDSWDEPKFR